MYTKNYDPEIFDDVSNVDIVDSVDSVGDKSRGNVIKSILIAIGSFLLGGAEIFNVIAPFGVAIVSTIPKAYLLPCIIGTVLSSFLFINSTQVGFIILSILLAGGLRIILENLTCKFSNANTKPIFYTLVSLSSMTIGVFFHSLINVTSSYSVVLLIMQVVLAGCFAYFFAIAIDALLNNKISKLLSHIQLTSIGVLTIILICGASSFHISSLNIGVILSVLLIYVITNKFNLFGASMISIVVSIALNLYSPYMLGFTAVLIISSFFSGIFSVQGKFFQITSFLLISSFSYIFLGSIIDLTTRVIDIFFATAIYILLPNKLFAFLDSDTMVLNSLSSIDTIQNTDSVKRNVVSHNSQVYNSVSEEHSNVQKLVCEKLLFASSTMQELKENLTTISEKFLNIEYNDMSTIPEVVSSVVCKNCSRNISCWTKHYDITMDNFNPIMSQLRVSGNIDEVSVPDYFLAKCCKLTRFIETINDYYNSFLIRQNVKRQVCESRSMVFEQFSSISDLLCEISQELDSVAGYDESIARKAMVGFCELEQEPVKLSCSLDKVGKKTIEIYTDKILQSSPAMICKLISMATNCNFDNPDITIVNEKTKITLSEKPKYKLDFAIKQSCFKDNILCGDTVETFTNSRGQAYFLLSDGMGKGTRAAIDSVMTCSSMSKLLKAGFGIESSIKLINSSLVVKSTDESLATIDLATIDLYTGEVELVKAGATSSFIYKSATKDVERIETASLPIGILQKPEYDGFTTSLNEGDVCLLVTDGVTGSEIDVEESWIVGRFEQLCFSGLNGEEMAQRLCDEAQTRGDDNHQDDITVVVVRVLVN